MIYVTDKLSEALGFGGLDFDDLSREIVAAGSSERRAEVTRYNPGP